MNIDGPWAKEAIDRMKRAGWIKDVVAQKSGFVVSWTTEGRQKALMLGRLYEELSPTKQQFPDQVLNWVFIFSRLERAGEGDDKSKRP